jgi:cell division protein ZapB
MKPTDPAEQLAQLADRVERLVELTRRLADENRSLRTSQDQLIGERAALLTKNEQARSRVEAMIVRLKSLEQNA